MKNSIFIIAHAPLAYALRQCALHVFPDCSQSVVALDVQPNVSPEETQAAARILMAQMQGRSILVLADVMGATPCNIAQKLVDGIHSKLIAGVNVPMLLRSVTYLHEPLDCLAARALAGGSQGVVLMAGTPPQNQMERKIDTKNDDHQQ